MLEYFSPSDCIFRAQDELAKCKQTGKDLKGYINAFSWCLVRIPHISEQEKVDRLLRGLSPALYEKILPHVDFTKRLTFEACANFAERQSAVSLFMQQHRQ